MKRFKDLKEELLNEGGEMYPADDMTMKEIKIACYAAQNILGRLEDGQMIQRWQISAIVKAKEELASVYTSMSADEEDEWEDEEEWDDMDEEDPVIVGYEYPSMYEETELDEAELNLTGGSGKKPSSLDKTQDYRTQQIKQKFSSAADGASKHKPGDKVHVRVNDLHPFVTRSGKTTSHYPESGHVSGTVVKHSDMGTVHVKLDKPVSYKETVRGKQNTVKKDTIEVSHKRLRKINEETELDEGFKEKIKGIIRREKEKEYPLIQNRRDVAHNKAAAAYASGDQKKGDRYMKWRDDNMKKEEVELGEAPLLGPKDKIHRAASMDQSDREYLHQRMFKDGWKSKNPGKEWPGYEKAGYKHPSYRNEETDYEVDVEGLPKMYVKADNPSQVKNNLRKVVKNPEMIKGVERVAKATLQKIFRDKASGKEVTEEVELDEASDLRITMVYNKFPKKATYAVHSHDRKYYKEFDSMDAAKAHKAEKTGK